MSTATDQADAEAKAFRLVAIGALFLIDITVGYNQARLGLTPDAVAFTLFALAAGRLAPYHRTGAARTVSWVFAALAALHFVLDLRGTWTVPAGRPGLRPLIMPAGAVFEVALGVGGAVVIWLLFGAIIEFAHGRGASDLAQQAHVRRWLNVLFVTASALVFVLLVPLFLAGPAGLAVRAFFVVWSAGFVAALTVYALTCVVAFRAAAHARVPPAPPSPPVEALA